jgi:hypothetical protein
MHSTNRPEAAPNTADLFEIIRTTRFDAALEADPVPNELAGPPPAAGNPGEISAIRRA